MKKVTRHDARLFTGSLDAVFSMTLRRWGRRTIAAWLAAWVLAGVACGPAGSTRPVLREITILHTNDLHATLLPLEDGSGGFAHLATAIQQERARSRASLLVDGGDLVQGSPVSTLFEGVPVFELANVLGIEVGAIGNHEFDYGWHRIADFQSVARFPLLAANIMNDAGQQLTSPGYVIKDVGGVRVGIIGVMVADTEELLRPRHLGPWRASPVVPVITPIARALKSQVDLVMVLGHLEYEDDRDILEQIPDVTLVVSGHNHDGHDMPMEVDSRFAVKVKSHGRELGRIDLTVDTSADRIVSWKWQALPVHGAAYPADTRVAALVDGWESKVSAIVDVPIGTARSPLSRERLRTLLQGALVQELGVDVAYLNPGGIRSTLPAGTILARHVWNVLPFDNDVVIANVRGADLPDVVKAENAIDPTRMYRFGTIDFLAETAFASSGVRFEALGTPMRDLAVEWIRRQRILE
jgi:5'-nucleotidase / UDP-sugar diphosphatase